MSSDEKVHAIDMSPLEAIKHTVMLAEKLEGTNSGEELRDLMDEWDDDKLFTAFLAAASVCEWCQSLVDFYMAVAKSRGYDATGYQVGLGPPAEDVD